jgi:DNA-directed RNA polymerase specialized sigma subunit
MPQKVAVRRLQMDDQILATLKELLKWTRIQAVPSVKAMLESVLPKAEHRRLYQALDGTKTQQQMAKELGISQPTVSRMVSAWLKAGIADEESSGRYIRSFDLRQLGIEETKEEA